MENDGLAKGRISGVQATVCLCSVGFFHNLQHQRPEGVFRILVATGNQDPGLAVESLTCFEVPAV